MSLCPHVATSSAAAAATVLLLRLLVWFVFCVAPMFCVLLPDGNYTPYVDGKMLHVEKALSRLSVRFNSKRFVLFYMLKFSWWVGRIIFRIVLVSCVHAIAKARKRLPPVPPPSFDP